MTILDCTLPKVICSNPDSKNNYFAWPTVGRLGDGTLAMVCSGFRIRHVCPFGKGVICYSKDEGVTWTNPEIIIDTPLDNRDCGIVVSGNSVIVTSFTNSVEFQRSWNTDEMHKNYGSCALEEVDTYLDTIDDATEDRYLGSIYILSSDGGHTYSDIKKVPVTSPHGPCVDMEGRFVYVGRSFAEYSDNESSVTHRIECYISDADGNFVKTADIPSPDDAKGLVLCEPHAIVLPDGKIVVHIRAHSYDDGNRCFTLYQSESYDGGYTFTIPHRILSNLGGAPSHLMLHSSGILIATYGYREKPYGIRAMFSKDDGQTWDTDNVICDGFGSPDMGYPSTVELDDGKLLTVYYSKDDIYNPAEISQVIWDFKEDE